MKGMKYVKAGRNRAANMKEKTKEEEGGELLAEEDITLADRRLRYRITTLDKFCEAFVQGTPDAKPDGRSA
jgi:hypothetical protein